MLKKYQLGTYVTGPLPVYLQQLRGQDPNVYAFSSQFTNQPTPTMPDKPLFAANVGRLPTTNVGMVTAPNIDTSKALVSQGGTSGDAYVNGSFDENEPSWRNGFRAVGRQLDMFTTALLGISNKYRNNKNDRAARDIMNNPYMGLIPSYNGRSEGVRYGYNTYAEGGYFEELYRQLEDEALAEGGEENKSVKVEPPTTSQVDAAQRNMFLKAQKKQIGRDIIDSYQSSMTDFFQPDETDYTPDTTSESQETPDLIQRFKNGIMGVESGGDYWTDSPYSTAYGKYQFIEGTRNAVREKYFPSMGKKEFERNYRIPQFQEQVMDLYSKELLNKYKDPRKAAIAFFLGEGKANKVNTPSYRPTKNNASVGEYLNKFNRGFYK